MWIHTYKLCFSPKHCRLDPELDAGGVGRRKGCVALLIALLAEQLEANLRKYVLVGTCCLAQRTSSPSMLVYLSKEVVNPMQFSTATDHLTKTTTA